MKHWLTTPDAADESMLGDVVSVLRSGGVIAFPTDTLYGLAVDPWNAAAVERLFEIKGRDAGRALPLVAADLAQVESRLGRLNALARRLALEFWPGPLSLIVPAPPSLPPALLGRGPTVAVRVPGHPIAIAVPRMLGSPVTSTSANRSGDPATEDPGQVIATIGDRLDGVLDAGRLPGGPPSTLVDVCGDTPALVRPGAVAWERVVQFLSS